MNPQKAIIFDLDDTLYPEIDFLHSSYRYVARQAERQFGLDYDDCLDALMGGSDAFTDLENMIIARCGNQGDFTQHRMVELYRYHQPDIALPAASADMLRQLAALPNATLALLTDGRSATQRAKIEALGLKAYFGDRVFISGETGFDKTDSRAFAQVTDKISADTYIYIGDNPAKDFYHPNLMGWTTVQLRDVYPTPIHSSQLPVDPAYHPQHIVSSIAELTKIITSAER